MSHNEGDESDRMRVQMMNKQVYGGVKEGYSRHESSDSAEGRLKNHHGKSGRITNCL